MIRHVTSVEMTAKIYDIGRGTAYKQARLGAIPTVRLGRRLVVPVAKLAEALGTTPEALSRTIDLLEAGDLTAATTTHAQVA